MTALLRGWRYLYGENPLHLLAMIGCFALSGYVVSLLWTEPSLPMIAVWFAGAVIGHDLVLYPVYAFADQPLTILRWGRRRLLPQRPPLVPAINHVRLPFLGSMVLGLIWFPSITGRGAEDFAFTAGHPMLGQFDHWLLITGALFIGSAVIYALRLGLAGGHRIVGLVHRRSAPDHPAEVPTEAFAQPTETPTEKIAAPTAPVALPGGPATGSPTDGSSSAAVSEEPETAAERPVGEDDEDREATTGDSEPDEPDEPDDRSAEGPRPTPE